MYLQIKIEEHLLLSTQRYEGHVDALTGEIEKLSLLLNKERDQQKEAKNEISALHCQMDEMKTELLCSNDQVKVLRQELQEVRTHALVLKKDLEAERLAF